MARGVGDVMEELSQRYRRDLFHKDPPAEPISNVELLLAALVVLPEAAAVLLLLLQLWGRRTPPRHWYGREGLTCSLVLIAGAAALVGVSYLDKQEHAGDAWRAATVRLGTRLPVNQAEEDFTPRDAYDYRERVVTYGETLFVVARTGFWPAQTRRLVVGSAAAYAAPTALVIAQALVQAFFPPRPSELTAEQWPRVEGQEKGMAGGAGGAEAGGDPPPPPAPMLTGTPLARLCRAAALSVRRHPPRPAAEG